MEPNDATAGLLAKFEDHGKFFARDLNADTRIRPLMLEVMSELDLIVAGAEVRLAVGVIAHNTDVEAGEDMSEMAPSDVPNLYDFVIVTDKLLVSAWGRFDVESGTISAESTTVKSFARLTSVTQFVQPGTARESGSIADHHEIQVVFADGSSEQIPGLENELSPEGRRSMAALVPALYSAMAS